MTEWYYIGHYGRLGPLTREQMDELVEGGVVTSETYVWHSGIPDWTVAGSVPALDGVLRQAAPFVAPPPPPAAPQRFASQQNQFGMPTTTANLPQTYSHQSMAFQNPYALQSTKSRTVAGILNILLPGVGRMYLGYLAYGLMQLILTVCTFGTLHIWSFVDGIIILSGGIKHDGYGRILTD